MGKDIQNIEDIEALVNHFYNEVMKDKLLAPSFQHVDFSKHLPLMVQFWSFALLEIPGYTTNLFEVHKHMPLQKVHFEHWLNIFNQSVDALFSGTLANQAKQKALIIGISMESKIVK